MAFQKLRAWLNQPRTDRVPRRSTCRLRLEQLEDRCVPAVTYTGISAATDSGAVGDNITNNPRPELSGTADHVDAVKVKLLDFNGAPVAEGNVVAGNWTITPVADITDGSYTRIQAFDAGDVAIAGEEVILNQALTIDTGPPFPAPDAPTFSPSSDDGSFTTDRITGKNTVTFTGTGEADATINLLENGALVNFTTADAMGNWSLTVVLGNGVHALSVEAVDVAGNRAAVSPATTVTIDKVLASPVTDLTAQMGVSLGKIKKRGLTAKRDVTVTNNSGRTLYGKVFLVLKNLPKKTKVKGATGVTAAGVPFIAIDVPEFAPGAKVTFALTFKGRGVNFTPNVQVGFGTPK